MKYMRPLDAAQSHGELLRIQRGRRTNPGSISPRYCGSYTLERRGLVGKYQYRLELRPLKQRRYRVGYGSQTFEPG